MADYKNLINKYTILPFAILYLSLLTGFFLDENATLGAKVDFLYHLKTLVAFDKDLNYFIFLKTKIFYKSFSKFK